MFTCVNTCMNARVCERVCMHTNSSMSASLSTLEEAPAPVSSRSHGVTRHLGPHVVPSEGFHPFS